MSVLDRGEERSEGFASCLPMLIALALAVGISHVVFSPIGFFLVVALAYLAVFSVLSVRLICKVVKGIKWKNLLIECGRKRTLAGAGMLLAIAFFLLGLLWWH